MLLQALGSSEVLKGQLPKGCAAAGARRVCSVGSAAGIGNDLLLLRVCCLNLVV